MHEVIHNEDPTLSVTLHRLDWADMMVLIVSVLCKILPDKKYIYIPLKPGETVALFED